MKSEQFVTLYTSLLLGISLIFFPSIGYSLDGSSHSSKVGRYEPTSSSEIYNNPCSGSKKFIMDSYYEKHENFVDQIFDDFLAQELPVNLCEVLPCDLNTVVSLSVLWNIKGEGSHRQLSSTMKFNIKEAISQLPKHHCKIIVIERLPSGVFADPFELEHLLHRYVFTDVAVFGDTNLELPSALSNLSVVEVHKDLGLNVLSHDKHMLDFTIDLPLHSRYPPLHESGYVGVKLKAPDLFLQCNMQGRADNGSCLFKLKNDDTEFDFTWSIPAGKRSDAGFVTVLTSISGLLSALSIILASLYSTEVKLLKDLKQC